MVEPQKWSAADDAYLKGALAALKHDVDELPLPDVRFVKARGKARRRRLQALTAAGSAAAVVIAVLAFGSLGRNTGSPVQPATRTSSTSTPTTPSLLGTASVMPLAQEWSQALGLSAPMVNHRVDPPEVVECGDGAPGAPTRQESLQVPSPNVQGAQNHWSVPSGTNAESAAAALADGVAACQAGPGFTVTPVATASWPRIYAYTARDAGSGWFAIALSKNDIAMLQVVDPDSATSRFTKAQVGQLAEIATQRLARYGTGSSPSTATSPSSTNGPNAINEKMPVAGVQPLISSNLFVAASQWASPGLTSSQKAYAGPGEPEGGLGGVVQCETDDYLSGIAGRYGIVKIRSGSGSANYMGTQRVRLFEDVEADSLAKTDVTRTKTMLEKGCSFPNGTVKATAGPSDGTYRLDTVFNDGSPTFSQWVGVTTQKTPGAVSTIVITKAADPNQAFAELDRLMALARQK